MYYEDRKFSRIQSTHSCGKYTIIVWKIGKKWNFTCLYCQKSVHIEQLLGIKLLEPFAE